MRIALHVIFSWKSHLTTCNIPGKHEGHLTCLHASVSHARSGGKDSKLKSTYWSWLTLQVLWTNFYLLTQSFTVENIKFLKTSFRFNELWTLSKSETPPMLIWPVWRAFRSPPLTSMFIFLDNVLTIDEKVIIYSSARNMVNMKRTQIVNSVYSSSVTSSPVTASPFFSRFSIRTASVYPKWLFFLK